MQQGVEWCQRDFYGISPVDVLRFSWEAFERTVKHRTRYVFAMTPAAEDPEEDVLSPAPFLRLLGEQVVELGLVRSIGETDLIWRARVHDVNVIVADAATLGTPDEAYCSSPNRMSPAGIPMFYGAFATDTAVAETYDPTRDAESRIDYPAKTATALQRGARGVSVPWYVCPVRYDWQGESLTLRVSTQTRPSPPRSTSNTSSNNP